MRILCICLFSFLCCSTVLAGEQIAYSHFSKDGYWQIWVMNAKGGYERQVTFSKMDKRDPVWLDQGRLAYRTNNGQLYILDPKQGTEQEILPQFKNINNPSFSSTTNEITFVRHDPRTADISGIWRMDLEGRNPRLLTQENAFVYQPVFSPRADKIVFVKADRDRKEHHLWMMPAEGISTGENQLQPLTHGPGYHTLPHFSPDGQYLTFSSNRDGQDYEIYILDLNTMEIVALTNNDDLDSSSFFSPDGQKIVFVSNRSGNQQIWLMSAEGGSASGGNRDGSKPRQLTRGKDESIDPAWSK